MDLNKPVEVFLMELPVYILFRDKLLVEGLDATYSLNIKCGRVIHNGITVGPVVLRIGSDNILIDEDLIGLLKQKNTQMFLDTIYLVDSIFGTNITIGHVKHMVIRFLMSTQQIWRDLPLGFIMSDLDNVLDLDLGVYPLRAKNSRLNSEVYESKKGENGGNQ